MSTRRKQPKSNAAVVHGGGVWAARGLHHGLLCTVALSAGLLAMSAGDALAHSGGVSSTGCGCHGAGDVAISLAHDGGTLVPGETVTVTVTVASAGSVEAGMFLRANEGTLSTIGGAGLAEVEAGLTHGSPRAMAGGQAEFSFRWTAPDSPGAVRFELWAVGANGNNSNSGDGFDDALFDFVYGCEPQTYYLDTDGDGFGRRAQTLVHCMGATPPGYAVAAGDCNDSRAQTYPGATEFCNQIDDDCDDEVDENAKPVTLYPDADGDGYYGYDEGRSRDTMEGCVPTEGFADAPGDCRPADPLISPAAAEVCNGFDDDCDGDVDEQVRPICGQGACRREGASCDPAACQPGTPSAERCNLLDDDCDGQVDEDNPCDAGSVCEAGQCVAEPGPTDPGTTTDSGSGGGALDGSTTDSSSGFTGADAEAAGCGCRSPAGPAGPPMAWLVGLVVLYVRPRGIR